MPNDNDAQFRGWSDHETRRWRIGIAISLIFGIFGAVMTYLTYSMRAGGRSPAPATAAPQAAETQRGETPPAGETRGKGHGHRGKP